MTVPAPRRPAPMRAVVRRTTRLTPHLVRVTLGGADLDRFTWPGPAAHLKLMLPEPGAADVVLPEPDGGGMVDYGSSPITMRTYTACAYRSASAELDLEVVLHGQGPAATWAAGTQPGDRVAVSNPRSAGFQPDSTAQWTLLGGDASALPALATIAATLTGPVSIFVELDDPVDRLPLSHSVTWLEPGQLQPALLTGLKPLDRGQVWVAGEAGVIRRIRLSLLERLNRDQVTTRGYWRAGATNHPDHDYGEPADVS